LQVGDAIIEVQGQRVEDSRDLARKIADVKPGTPADMTVMRDGREQSVTVELGQFPTSDRMAALTPSEPSEMQMEDLGITLAPADGGRGEQGVRIEDVEAGSVAAEKGLRAGDVIDEVGGEPVFSPRDVRQSMNQMRGDQSEVVVLRIRRGDQRRFVALPLEQR
jgi:serine protease Do